MAPHLPTDYSHLLGRVVLPSRLALIYRDGRTLGYNPAENVWHSLDEIAAETLRWVRAGRPRDELCSHLIRRFSLEATDAPKRLGATIGALLLRRLLFLDRVPEIIEPHPPDRPLISVYWISTQACNLRCTYCYQDASIARPNELSTQEAKILVEQAVEVGARSFVITGGEPFSRKDLLEIAQYSRECGLKTTVITNGAYITKDTIDAVARTFHLVTVSLDHVRPEHHDRFRGKGSWRHATRAIDLLLAAGVPVDVNSTLTRPGLGDLSELLRLRREKAIGQHKIVPSFPMGRGAKAKEEELTSNQLIGLNDRILGLVARDDSEVASQLRVEGDKGQKGMIRQHCGAGLSEVSVDPEGWVYPCRLLQYPQFRTLNVREHRIAEIYEQHPVLKTIQTTKVKQLSPCNTCIIRDACGGGCRGIHFSYEGEYATAHPLFCAYLRRSFEGQAWRSTGSIPPARRAQFVNNGRIRKSLPLLEE